MVDQSPREDLQDSGDGLTSVPDIITDLVAEAAVPGIPAPVRRNFLRAFGQLCTATIDIPAAYLTGIADERRAETAARIKLINTSAAQIAEQMKTEPEYARAAVAKFGQRVLREQINLDLISQKTARDLLDNRDPANEPMSDGTGDSIDDDWLNAFEMEARQKSTDEMQDIFARILAGEIRRPGTFSTRTVKIMGSLDQNVASHFVRLCSMSMISQGHDSRVASLGGNAGDNALRKYGLDFSTINLLNEHGLVIADYNSWYEHIPCIAFTGAGSQVVCIPFTHQGRHWILSPSSRDVIGKKVRIHGVALTRSGSELLQVVHMDRVDDYTRDLAQWFERKKFRMTEVSGNAPRVLNKDAGTFSALD